MTGALLNLISYGNINVVINGNPRNDLFFKKWHRYTNFGMEKIRISPLGTNFSILERAPTTYRFRIGREYGDLLKDLTFVVNLPNIWSPINVPTWQQDQFGNIQCQPYEFKWIDNLGCEMIKNIKISYGNNILQEFSGTYIHNKSNRDLSNAKLNLFNEMTGNIPELNDPANAFSNNGRYPSSLKIKNNPTYPSIRGRKLYIPICFWFSENISQSLPLCAVDYNEIFIDIIIRPLRELFVVRDQRDYMKNRWTPPEFSGLSNLIGNDNSNPTGGGTNQLNPLVQYDNNYQAPYVSTMNTISPYYQMYLFLTQINHDYFLDWGRGDNLLRDPPEPSQWNIDPHLICTYIVVEDEERNQLKNKVLQYVFKEVHEINFLADNFSKKRRIKIKTNGLVSNWMWFLRRSDVALRNEWTNYTNWVYKNIEPYKSFQIVKQNYYNNLNFPINKILCKPPCLNYLNKYSEYFLTPTKGMDLFSNSNWLNQYDFIKQGYPFSPPVVNSQYRDYNLPQQPFITGQYRYQNKKRILKSWSVNMDGNYRENTLDAGVLEHLDFMLLSSGAGIEGLYFYNFGLTTNGSSVQPSGMMNLNNFMATYFDIETISPPEDTDGAQYPVCKVIGNFSENLNQLESINKPSWKVFKYGFDFYVMEESYNILEFKNGLIYYLFNNQQ